MHTGYTPQMEIHAPESPVHSFKDFLIHISIVTVGILIALGLEGLRETLHDRHLVRETRENVHTEMGHNLEHAREECGHVSAYAKDLQTLSEQVASLAARPQMLRSRLDAGYNSGYFLAANSWQTALSTGVLAHMPTAEVSAYAYAAEGVARYTALQNRAQLQESIAKTLVSSQLRTTPEGEEGAIREVLLFSREEGELAYVCPQMQDDLERAYRASGSE